MIISIFLVCVCKLHEQNINIRYHFLFGLYYQKVKYSIVKNYFKHILLFCIKKGKINKLKTKKIYKFTS